MKRICLFLIAITGPLTVEACQEKIELETRIDIVFGSANAPLEEDYLITFEEIMPLDKKQFDLPQGGDCWGNYFFQFTSGNNRVYVFDLALKTVVQTIDIPRSQHGFVSSCHCNTVSFGTEYFDVNDLFPLIYVSTGYASDGYTGVLVYRIRQDWRGRFSITLVQTIKIPAVDNSWIEFIPAGEEAYLCYTGLNLIYRVKMPRLMDGDIVIRPEDALETYQFPPRPDWLLSSRYQDRLFQDGKIIYITGVPPGEASALVVLDLQNRKREMIVDFKKNGLTSESESIFVWQGDLCVAFADGIVRLIL